MTQFIGKWTGDGDSYTNYEEFAKASGVSEDLIEKFRNAKSTLEFKQDGEYWMCDASSDVTPSKCYKFKSGEEVTTTGPFGKGLKFTITIDSDSKMTMKEQSELMGWKTVKVMREIKGDKLITTMELENGIQMTAEMTRC
ncbi:gastrotropin-like [Mytilus californianus]|uniref:gastrotropin-like n=1 Tax=Mytilus californianus TaxID=6549 RepID=UPI00224825F1|nr:gastrotropin-like [Mytilus californianus]